MSGAGVTTPPPPTSPPPPAEPPTRPRRRTWVGWFRHVLANAALFAVGGTIALLGLRLFMPVPVAVVPPAAVGDSAAALPDSAPALPSHAPVVVFSPPRLGPIVVRPPLRPAPRLRPQPILLFKTPMERARGGASVRVNVTAYCLKGITRRDHAVRRGIIAADPRYFPLGRYVDLTIGFGYHGRYLVDDTGKDIQGLRLDVWTESCDEARRFGRRFGSAKLVPR